MTRKLSEYWKRNPDMRLGQLVCSLTGVGSACFYAEDDETERGLDEKLEPEED